MVSCGLRRERQRRKRWKRVFESDESVVQGVV